MRERTDLPRQAVQQAEDASKASEARAHHQSRSRGGRSASHPNPPALREAARAVRRDRAGRSALVREARGAAWRPAIWNHRRWTGMLVRIPVAGIATVTVVPRPCPALAAWIVPPCA